jgi:hypothetical protein
MRLDNDICFILRKSPVRKIGFQTIINKVLRDFISKSKLKYLYRIWRAKEECRAKITEAFADPEKRRRWLRASVNALLKT